jgi:hypothetical protein
VGGVIERDGGTLYCTMIFVSPEKGLVGKHRKILPTAAERLVWGFGGSDTLPVLDVPFVPVGDKESAAGDEKASVKVSATICWYVHPLLLHGVADRIGRENYMPLRMYPHIHLLN